jgi:hypothetical protein
LFALLDDIGDSPSAKMEVPAIQFPALVFDVAFHPQQDVLAVGLVSGHLEL